MFFFVSSVVLCFFVRGQLPKNMLTPIAECGRVLRGRRCHVGCHSGFKISLRTRCTGGEPHGEAQSCCHDCVACCRRTHGAEPLSIPEFCSADTNQNAIVRLHAMRSTHSGLAAYCNGSFVLQRELCFVTGQVWRARRRLRRRGFF